MTNQFKTTAAIKKPWPSFSPSVWPRIPEASKHSSDPQTLSFTAIQRTMERMRKVSNGHQVSLISEIIQSPGSKQLSEAEMRGGGRKRRKSRKRNKERKEMEKKEQWRSIKLR